jgi:uncharacterized protein with PIN domain
MEKNNTKNIIVNEGTISKHVKGDLSDGSRINQSFLKRCKCNNLVLKIFTLCPYCNEKFPKISREEIDNFFRSVEKIKNEA